MVTAVLVGEAANAPALLLDYRLSCSSTRVIAPGTAARHDADERTVRATANHRREEAMTQEQDELVLMHMDRIDAKAGRMQHLLHEFGASLTAVELQLLALERDRLDHREALIRARQRATTPRPLVASPSVPLTTTSTSKSSLQPAGRAKHRQ